MFNEIFIKMNDYLESIHIYYLKNKNIINLLLFIFLFFVCFLTINSRVFSDDDLYYCCNIDTKLPIQNIQEIILFQKKHYLEWGGRLPAHTLLQFLFLIDKPLSSIILTFTFFLLSSLITIYALESQFDIKYMLLTSALLVFLNPAFDETLLWMTGAANYLCMSVIYMFGIYPFVMYLKKNNYKVYSISFSIIISFLSGWTNENIGITLIFIMMFCIYDYYKTNKKISAWMLANIISLIVGFLFLIFAPGNFVRADNTVAGLMKIFYRLHGQINAFGNWLLPLLILLILLCFISYKLKIKITKINYMFIFAGIFSILVMFASPTYPSRATFGSLVLLLVPCISIISKIASKDETNNRFINLIILILYTSLIGKYLSIALVAIARGLGANIPG